MSATYASTELTVVQCWCGILFSVPDALWMEYERKNDLNPSSFSIHCPIGHGFTRGARNRVKELETQLASARARLDQERARSETLEKRVAAAKGQVTKIRNRVGNGICPCCRRSFSNLARHMASKHPDYKNGECEAVHADH